MKSKIKKPFAILSAILISIPLSCKNLNSSTTLEKTTSFPNSFLSKELNNKIRKIYYNLEFISGDNTEIFT